MVVWRVLETSARRTSRESSRTTAEMRLVDEREVASTMLMVMRSSASV